MSGTSSSGVQFTEFDYLVASKIAINDFQPYLELSTYSEKEVFISLPSVRNQEKETIIKISIENLSSEAREIFNLLYFGSEEELEPFKNDKYTSALHGISKNKILNHFTKKFGAKKMKVVCWELKKLSELF